MQILQIPDLTYLRPEDRRRDSGWVNQGQPTFAGAEANAWPTGQQTFGANVTPANPGYGQAYAGSSSAHQGTYNTSSYGSTSNARYPYAATANTYQYSNGNAAQTQSGAERKLPRGKGPSINGEYVPGKTPHYEELDSSFQVQSSQFFTEGKVFAIMWNETASATLKPVDYNTSTSLSQVKHAGNIVYTNVRRFVVVRRKREFCFACPIFTYSERGCTKRGVHASEHAIAYSWGNSPQLLQGESGITKPAISVVMNAGLPPLHVASRIYFGIHHPIQYNVKVKEIGYVPPAEVHTLISNWTAENLGTNQAADVTADAD